MCGIVLAYTKNMSKKQNFINKGLDIISHRGQDSCNRLNITKNLSIGHRRLSITGGISGNQPIINNDLIIMTNGEFYDHNNVYMNYPAYSPITNSDAESIIPLFLDKSIPFINQIAKLNGEFVFVIIDQINSEISFCRDRIGNKTLYYAINNNELFISSEIKSFKSIQKLQFSESVLKQKLSFQYHEPSLTLFEGIKQVEPGSLITYNYKNNTMKIDFFYDLYQNNKYIDYNSTDLLNLLRTSVERRLLNQKPALTLSGGLDSSIILELTQSIDKNIKDCFSISFTDGGVYDEQDIVKKLAKKYDLNLHLISVTQDMLIDNLEESLYFAEDVTINLHMPAKFLLFKEIKKHGFNVSLSGEGSDEFFLGYSHFFPNENSLLKGMHLPDSNIIDINEKKLPIFLQAKLSIGYKIQELLTKEYKIDSINLYNSKILNSIEQASYLWSKYALSNSILIALGDKMEMASTIEGRTPFLDIDVLKYIMSIRLEDKYSIQQDKKVLRELFKDKLPEEVINSKKHPFIAPPLLGTIKGLEFVRATLENWNTSLINKDKINKKLNLLLLNNDINELRTYDPVFMILVSLALIQKRMIDD